MAVIPLVISAAGAAASGVAASNAANYQAQVAKNNADISAQKQRFLMQDYAQRQTAMAKGDRAKMGSLEAGLAAAGMDVNTGSAKGVLAGEREILADNRMAHAKAFSEDWYSEKTRQVSANAQARLAGMEAENDIYAGALKAGGSLISGGSSIRNAFGDMGGFGG